MNRKFSRCLFISDTSCRGQLSPRGQLSLWKATDRVERDSERARGRDVFACSDGCVLLKAHSCSERPTKPVGWRWSRRREDRKRRGRWQGGNTHAIGPSLCYSHTLQTSLCSLTQAANVTSSHHSFSWLPVLHPYVKHKDQHVCMPLAAQKPEVQPYTHTK